MIPTFTPLINPVPQAGSEEKVEALFQHFKQKTGKLPNSTNWLPNGVKLFGISPFLLEDHINSIGYFIEHPTLSITLVVMISMLIAKNKRCTYYITENENILIRAGFKIEILHAVQKDPKQASLNEKDKAMLLLVLKAVDTPNEVTKSDIQAVRTLGWTDFDIFDAVNYGAIAMAVYIVTNTFNALRIREGE